MGCDDEDDRGDVEGGDGAVHPPDVFPCLVWDTGSEVLRDRTDDTCCLLC